MSANPHLYAVILAGGSGIGFGLSAGISIPNSYFASWAARR